MADKTPEQEPSIEEILASIRQIISDDEDKDGEGDSAVEASAPVIDTPKQAPQPEPVTASVADIDAMFDSPAMGAEPEVEEDDILELTDALPPEPDSFPEDQEIDLALQEIQETLDEEEIPAMPPESPKDEPLLSNSARQTTIASMAKLVGNTPINRPTSYGSVTLEDIVREMLHPMLKDWMNDNLPPMVERIVQKELEKLARRALDE